MEQPPHPMRLGDEHDYYARGPELVRQAPGGGGVGGAARESEAQQAGQEVPVAAPQGADHPAAVRVRTRGQS
jgi:NADH-quinone oxidoreductase subunit I